MDSPLVVPWKFYHIGFCMLIGSTECSLLKICNWLFRRSIAGRYCAIWRIICILNQDIFEIPIISEAGAYLYLIMLGVCWHILRARGVVIRVVSAANGTLLV